MNADLFEDAALLGIIVGAKHPQCVDAQLMVELARTAPVQLPDDFEVATRMLMRAIEVLDRNGALKVEVRSAWGPLRPVVGFRCSW